MYTVREKFKNIFEIANFTDYKEPDAVYYVKKGRCSCPASYRSKKCKHIALVDEFVKSNKEHIYLYELTDNNVVTKTLFI